MSINVIQSYFVIAVFISIVILNFFIFVPFLQIAIMALVISVICQPVYVRVLRMVRGKESLASLVTTALVIILFLGPLVALAFQVFKESIDLYDYMSLHGDEKINDLMKGMFGWFSRLIPGSQEFVFDLDQYIEYALAFVVDHSGALFSSVSNIIFNVFIFFVTLFYALRDSTKLRRFITLFSPLDDDMDRKIVGSMQDIIHSVVGGTLVIALIQGLVTSLGLYLFGVPNMVLWGMVAAVCAIIPGFGTALVIVPASLYLFAVGQVGAGIGLLLWGALFVGLIDNFLGPRLIGHKADIHPLIILLSVLGGLSFFGPLGFILGPLATSFLLVFLNVYILKR